jgi:sulfur relay (sulfurtransferase) complex TusBCD TusD component (DsrE family)
VKTKSSAAQPAKILLSSRFSKERAGWFTGLLGESPPGESSYHAGTMIYLCGDALYSLIHPQISELWLKIAARPDISVYADTDDLADFGLLSVMDSLSGIQKGDRSLLLMDSSENPVSSAGFLHLYSPYMHRYTDFFLDFLHKAVDISVPLSAILYLDGVHLCHQNQVTSEFSNIEHGLTLIRNQASGSGIDIKVAACQRCSQARGYVHGSIDDCHSAPCFRKDVEISGLSSIIPGFSIEGPVFCTDSADFPSGDKEAYIHCISTSPYGTEHTFGAISWAVAQAGIHIPSRVIFVEDGTYAHLETPGSRIQGSVRDIHAVIEATAIPGLLEYYIWEPSLQLRGIKYGTDVTGDFTIPHIRPGEISMMKQQLLDEGYHVRVFIW